MARNITISNKITIIFLVILSGFATHAIFGRQSHADTVPARRTLVAGKMVLVDEKGQAVMTLSASNGHGSLTIAAGGRPRIVVKVKASGGAFIGVKNALGVTQVSLQVGSSGLPALELNDEKGRPRARLNRLDDGSVLFSFLDPNKYFERFVLSVGAFGQSGMYMMHDEHRAAFSVSRPPMSDAISWSLYDEEGKSRIRQIVSRRQVFISLSDANGNTRVLTSLLKNADPHFSMYDVRGKTLLELPR